ncbi:MAG: glycosyltransferase family 4 protein [Candidatus Schekmanbacteria bacterium]|nr:glycosyltransferase family 4 protein [Candidatus Schekmanbacteria bacterium]
MPDQHPSLPSQVPGPLLPGPLRIALVVQRYGADIRGGAEAHCRLVGRMLATRHRVEVLTTCAGDYETWAPRYAPGTARDGRVLVRRFKNRRRPVRAFFRLSQQLFLGDHDPALQREWIRLNGPESPRLLEYLERFGASFDLVVFFSFRYATTALGMQRVPDRAVLVPTAEDEPAVRLPIFRDIFCVPRGFLFNSHEEAEMIRGLAPVTGVPAEIVGVGVETAGESPDGMGAASSPPGRADAAEEPEVAVPFLLYVGRLDRNKGVPLLYQHFLRLRANGCGDLPGGARLRLVLLGGGALALPPHPDVQVLGPRPDRVKDAMLRDCLALVNASPYESLSMVLLEAWSWAKPVVVNATCAVMREQCRRSGGGLYFRSAEELEGCVSWLLTNPTGRQAIGRQGLRYFRANYAWNVIQTKYERLFGAVLARRGQPSPAPPAA